MYAPKVLLALAVHGTATTGRTRHHYHRQYMGLPLLPVTGFTLRACWSIIHSCIWGSSQSYTCVEWMGSVCTDSARSCMSQRSATTGSTGCHHHWQYMGLPLLPVTGSMLRVCRGFLQSCVWIPSRPYTVRCPASNGFWLYCNLQCWCM